MQIIDNVDLPLDLLDAQEAGQLVIFVGAGASMSAPSCMPNFGQLAADLGREALEAPPQPGEPLDRYLGYLESKEFNVHQKTREQLTSRESHPNDTHKSIISLALSSKKPRIITTNFDLLLNRAWEEADAPPQRWVGPALPLGDDFSGIVQIHGALDSQDNKLVLTDADFGQAYVTRSWAARFLVDVFNTFTVLFVGYSHEDPIMAYLAQGLPRETARFALLGTDKGSDDSRSRELMERLGISVIEYSADNSHAELPLVLNEWARRSNLNKLGLRQELEEIIRNLHSSTPVERDFLRREMSNDEGVSNFASIALKLQPEQQDAAYRWIRELEVFRSLFDRTKHCTVGESSLSFFSKWVAEYFVRDEDTVFEFWKCLSEFGKLLQEDFAYLLLTSSRGAQLHPVRKLVTYLRTSVPGFSAPVVNDWRRNFDVEWELLTEAEFSTIVEGRIELNSLTFGAPKLFGKRVSFGARWDIEPSDLEMGLQCIRENAIFADRTIVRILENSLRRLNSLLIALNPSDYYDVLTSYRSSIEVDETAYSELPLNEIINFLRDYALMKNADWSILDNWRESNVPVLQKIAIFGVARSRVLSQSEKIEWMLACGGLISSYAHFPEMRLLMLEIVNEMTSLDLDKLLGLLRIRLDEDANEANSYTSAYDCIRMLQVILNERTGWENGIQLAKCLEAKHPDLKYLDSKDASLMTSLNKPEYLPTIVEDLRNGGLPSEVLIGFFGKLQESPAHEYEIIRLECQALIGDSQDSALEIVCAAAELEHTNSREQFMSMLLGSLGGDALVRATGTIESLAGILHGQLEITALARAILEASESDPEIEETSRLENSIDILWSNNINGFDGQLRLSTSISSHLNDWPGILTTALCRLIYRRWELQRDYWQGVPDDMRSRINSMLDAPMPAASIVSGAFGASLRFLLAADEDFTIRTIIPLFDDSAKTRDGAWIGFLSNPFYASEYPAAEVFLGLLPYGWSFVSMLPQDRSISSTFFKLIETILMKGIYTESVSADILIRGTTKLSPPVLTEFYNYLGTALGRSQGLEIWKNGVRKFIQKRVNGTPRNMSKSERDAIAKLPFIAMNLAAEIFDVVGDTSFLKVEETRNLTKLLQADENQQKVLAEAYIERLHANGIRSEYARISASIMRQRANDQNLSPSVQSLISVLDDFY